MTQPAVATTRLPPGLLLLVLCLLCGWAPLATTNTGVQAVGDPPHTEAALSAKIDALTARQGLDEAVRAAVLKHYQAALHNLGNTAAYQERAAGFRAAIQQAPAQARRLQREIAQLQAKTAKQKPEDFSRLVTEELEQRLILEKEKLSGLDGQIKKLTNELALQNSRPQLNRAEMIAARQEMESGQKRLEALGGAESTRLEIEAEQISLRTLLDARAAELKMLELEAISHPPRVEALTLERQWLSLLREANSAVIASIESLLAERRQQAAKDAQDALDQAEKGLADKHPALQAVIRDNIGHSRALQNISGHIDRLLDKRAKLDEQATKIDAALKGAEKKISLASLSPELGRVLREQRRHLLRESQLAARSEFVQQQTALASLEQFKIDEHLKALADIDQLLRHTMATQVEAGLPGGERMMIQAELRVLLNNQRELLAKLADANGAYLRALGDFDFALQQMAAQARQFADYLDEHLLWVPSSPPVNLDYPAALLQSGQWLLAPHNWLGVAADTAAAIGEHPLLATLAAAAVAGLLGCRRRLRRRLAAIAAQVGTTRADHFHLTTEALACALLLALPLPLLATCWGWLLSHAADGGDFGKAVGGGLQEAALPALFLGFFHKVFADQGIARVHCQWRPAAVGLLHRQIGWLGRVAVPSSFIIGMTHGASATAEQGDSLGRLALVASLLAMTAFLHQVLNPRQCLLQPLLARNPNGWPHTFRHLWYAGLHLPPLAIIGFAVSGYYLSALELHQQLSMTFCYVVLALFVHQLALRWLGLVNKRLALADSRRQRPADGGGRPAKAKARADSGQAVDGQPIDLPKTSAQTTRLLNTATTIAVALGLWLIWGNIVPAFAFFEQIVLWQQTVVVNNQTTLQPVTLTNALLAGLYAFVIIVLTVNFSGFMELALSQTMHLDAGGRYAVKQLSKYFLVAAGVVAIANELGGSWQQVQWLVAALGVGLGFGLQEIFANLVSGIILLFERPIRIGDTVTIGQVTGKVSRIQMRATTITDWDQKELVVPNKTFITNELVNWTLSDATTRVVIEVGIAYGADVGLAHRVMMDTVRATPLVLASPEPYILLMEFGDSAMKFFVHVFVSEMAHRLPVIHDLHVRLEQALKDHRLTIPFPQLDLHIRPAPPWPATHPRPAAGP